MRLRWAAALGCAALALGGCQSAPEDPAAAPETAEAAEAAEAAETAESAEVRFTIRTIGDILLHSDVYIRANSLAAMEGREGYDFGPMFDPLRPYLEGADITTANMEVPVAGPEFGLSGYPAFNAPPEVIDALRGAGVDVVNNATNHTLDRGGDGAVASASNMRERGMLHVGGYQSWEDKAAPRVIDVGGVKVGFVAYTYGTNGIPVPEGREYTVSLIDYDAMRTEIAALDPQVDLLVAMLHMGEEYAYEAVDFQRETAAVAIGAGADLILGGHPHVVEPFEVLPAGPNGGGASGGVPVWWSHGNFLHGQHDPRTKIGGIGEFTFVQRADGAVELEGMRFMPTFMIGPPMSYEHSVIPLAEAGDYLDVAAEMAQLRERLGPDVTVVEYLPTPAHLQ